MLFGSLLIAGLDANRVLVSAVCVMRNDDSLFIRTEGGASWIGKVPKLGATVSTMVVMAIGGAETDGGCTFATDTDTAVVVRSLGTGSVTIS